MTRLETPPRSSSTGLAWLIAALVVAITCLVATWQFSKTPSIGDERFNGPQAQRIQQGDWEADPMIVMPLTYHAVIAGVANVLGVEGMQAYRIISLLLSIPAVFVFHRLCAYLPEPNRAIRTLQFFFLPALFPYFFVVYTDVFSLLLLLLAILLLEKRLDWAAGLLAIASTAVRQNNIIWLAFLMVMIHVRDHGWTLGVAALRSTAARCWTFGVGFALFALFVAINGGIAIGDKSMHPSFKLYSGNLFAALFLCGLFFLPLHLVNIPQACRRVLRHWWWIIPSIIATYCLYQFTFAADNPYNPAMQKLLINKIADSVDIRMDTIRTKFWRFLFFVACASTMLSLAVTPFRSKAHYLLYPASVLFLAPSWLIHARYYIIPFTLFLLFRKGHALWAEAATLLIMIGFAVAVLFFGLAL